VNTHRCREFASSVSRYNSVAELAERDADDDDTSAATAAHAVYT